MINSFDEWELRGGDVAESKLLSMTAQELDEWKLGLLVRASVHATERGVYSVDLALAGDGVVGVSILDRRSIVSLVASCPTRSSRSRIDSEFKPDCSFGVSADGVIGACIFVSCFLGMVQHIEPANSLQR